MIYNFTQDTTYDVAREIDVKEIRNFVEKKFDECETEEDLIVKLKKTIKNEKEFKIMVDELNISIKELLQLLAVAYPEMFNHYLIKYVRKNYLFKRKSAFEKL
jgi:hypothetical protein